MVNFFDSYHSMTSFNVQQTPLTNIQNSPCVDFELFYTRNDQILTFCQFWSYIFIVRFISFRQEKGSWYAYILDKVWPFQVLGLWYQADIVESCQKYRIEISKLILRFITMCNISHIFSLKITKYWIISFCCGRVQSDRLLAYNNRQMMNLIFNPSSSTMSCKLYQTLWSFSDRNQKGCYAISVTGRLPAGIVRELKTNGITYRSRDTSQKSWSNVCIRIFVKKTSKLRPNSGPGWRHERDVFLLNWLLVWHEYTTNSWLIFEILRMYFMSSILWSGAYLIRIRQVSRSSCAMHLWTVCCHV